MRINVAKYDPNGLGGGWSFARNFSKVMADNLTSYEEADIYFIASASMVSREEVEKAKQDGKKVVLRIDNIIRNSRNRNTGMTRMKDFAEWADLVIYQSKFAQRLLDNYLKPKNATIILNSVDQDIFNINGRSEPEFVSNKERYLYSKYSSDETKNFEMARLTFQQIPGEGKSLTLVGRYDSNLEQYNFDFYMGEKVNYVGLIDDPRNMAKIYKAHDYLLYSYFNDACSNTLIEAMSCGMFAQSCYGMDLTGGAPEIINKFQIEGRDYFSLPRMGGQYYEAMAKL